MSPGLLESSLELAALHQRIWEFPIYGSCGPAQNSKTPPNVIGQSAFNQCPFLPLAIASSTSERYYLCLLLMVRRSHDMAPIPAAICLCKECHLSVRLFARGAGNAILLPALASTRQDPSKTRPTRPNSTESLTIVRHSPKPRDLVFQYYHYNLEPPPKKSRRLRKLGLDGIVHYEYPQERAVDFPGWFQSVPASPPPDYSPQVDNWADKHLRGPRENFRGDNFRGATFRPSKVRRKQTQ